MIELDDKKIFGKIIALYSDVYFVVLVQPNLLKNNCLHEISTGKLNNSQSWLSPWLDIEWYAWYMFLFHAHCTQRAWG